MKSLLKRFVPNFLKKRLSRLKKKRRNKLLIKNTAPTTIEEIEAGLRLLGVKQGDCILLHSSLKSVGYLTRGPNDLLDAFIKTLLPAGTLVIPTYPLLGTMLKTCTDPNYIFDPNSSSSTVGAVPSSFLNYKGIQRSLHPTHSMSAIGKDAENITKEHHIGNKTYGANSPWSKIIEHNGKIIGVGISLAWHTIYHYVEDIMGEEFPIKVNVSENYNVKCKTKTGQLIDVVVNPLDPEIAKTRIEKNPFILKYLTEICEHTDVIKYGEIGAAKTWIVDAGEFCNLLIKLASIGITIYNNESELTAKNLYPLKLIRNKLAETVGSD